jgi:hypothetical protein
MLVDKYSLKGLRSLRRSTGDAKVRETRNLAEPFKPLKPFKLLKPFCLDLAQIIIDAYSYNG